MFINITSVNNCVTKYDLIQTISVALLTIWHVLNKAINFI